MVMTKFGEAPFMDKYTDSMLKVLAYVHGNLETYLNDKEGWESVLIDYHPPIVERVWRQEGDFRINLHKIHPCTPEEALFHTHPWPSAMLILDGCYLQGIGSGSSDVSPPIACIEKISKWDRYEMTEKDAWHFVAPVDYPVLSLMVTGAPWDRTAPKPDKELQPLEEKSKNSIIEAFNQKSFDYFFDYYHRGY